MAEFSNNSQVVSSIAVTDNVSVCPLISPDSSCDLVPSDLQKEPDVELIGGDASLQDVIDTELSYRVSGNVDHEAESNKTFADCREFSCTEKEIFDINSQFLMAERKSCFENLSTNATHFFTVIDEEVGPTGEVGDISTNGIHDHDNEFDSSPDLNGSNNYSELCKSPTYDVDFQHNSSSSVPLVDADIKYSSTFGETIVDCAGEEIEEVSCTEILEHFEDDKDLVNDPFVLDKNYPQNDPSSEILDPTPEKTSVNGIETVDVVPFQDFFTPITDDAYDIEFQEQVNISHCENEISNRITLEPSSEEVENPYQDIVSVETSEMKLSEDLNSKAKYTEDNISESTFEEHDTRDQQFDSVDVINQELLDKDVCLETTTYHSVHEQKDLDVCSTNSDSSHSYCSDLDSNEMINSSKSEKKIEKKKKKNETGESIKTKKTKKTKKEEKENISVKSSFSKFDQLSKKTVLHVRSVDTSKVQRQFNENASNALETITNCRSCGKQVFQMEQVKAERGVWHKNCFRCKECNKQLTVDNYSSNEGILFCQPHFKELFKPKAVLEDDTEPHILRRPKMIICENQPTELPPEVVRASDKSDLGLEELTSINIKSRYQAFEKTESTDSGLERSPSSISVKRSPSILSKLARFQAKGMDIGVADEAINNIPYEESSSSSEEEQENENGEKSVIRANRKQRERPMSFNKMDDIKYRWESGQTNKDERREERKLELQNIRSRLFMGKQGKMKEMYEQAVQESERGSQKKDIDVCSDKAKCIKEKFERGEVFPDDDDDENTKSHKVNKDDLGVFEEGISKKSRSLFLELDAKTLQQPPITSPVKSPTPRDEGRKLKEVSPQVSKDIVKASDKVEDVKVETSEVLNKFKFFETYKEPEREKRKFRITPPRDGQVKDASPETEIYRDPSVVRSEDKVEDEIVRTKTTSKMLSLFRQMEENASKEELPDGPKPLKRFTPPPDYTNESGASDEEDESEEDEEEEEEEVQEDEKMSNPNIVRASDKQEDEFLKQATTAARAKALRAKFEHWEEKENNLNSSSSGCNLDFDQSDQTSIESTKSLRAKFETLKNEAGQPKEHSRPKVNRFVESHVANIPLCSVCNEKVYLLEKIEMSGKIFHKKCFRCLQCNCILRMETYTFNNEKLYCIPHFKQLFITKGNYEEGFGFDQHKRKWNVTIANDDIFNE